MEQILRSYVMPKQVSGSWIAGLMLSLALPALILFGRPIGLTLRQSAVVAAVLLVIIWWSTGLVKKIPASVFLIAVFCLVSRVEMGTIFSFPLSETFPMIVITYLFSQGIANSGLIDQIFQPLLLRLVHTPCQCLLAITAMFYLTMYVIPQPLARVIIVAAMFHQFLKRTDLPEQTCSVLMYGVFLLFAVVNMSAKDADMIMNHVAAGFSEIPISNGMWMRYMLPPTLVTCALVLLTFTFFFRRELLGPAIKTRCAAARVPFSGRQKAALAVIVVTVLLWMSSGLHGINQTVITILATAILFGLGILHKEDLKTIDVTTLVFLTAAFSIGGVMKACGAADKVFGVLQGIFPAEFSLGYLLVMVLVSMLLHMILGSNTTTLSVAVPGMLILCGQAVSSPVIVFTAVASVSFHALLPFHSVAMMIGASNGYFPARYVVRMGIALTLLTFFAAAGVFYPYWSICGLFG